MRRRFRCLPCIGGEHAHQCMGAAHPCSCTCRTVLGLAGPFEHPDATAPDIDDMVAGAA